MAMRDRSPEPTETPRTIDRFAVRRMFARAGDGEYDFARAMTIARDALFDRLDDIHIAPARILDLGAGTGAAARELARRFRDADVVCVDPATSLLQRTRTSAASSGVSTGLFVAGEAENLPLKPGSVDLVLSSIAMPWFDPIDDALAECRRVLRPGGLLLLSTLGSGTLKELSMAWSNRVGVSRMHPFSEMHVLGDAMVRAGFADVVMDVERIRFQTPSFWGLCRTLSRSGGSSVLNSRRRGLTAAETFRTAAARYESLREPNGALPVSVEFVFGHAWAPGESKRRPSGIVPRMDWMHEC